MAKLLDIGGAVTSTSSWIAYGPPCDVYSLDLPWATGLPDINGLTRVYVESVTAKYLTGSAFPLITKGVTESTGGGWLDSGGTCRFTIRKTAGDTTYFGRNSGGSPSPVRNSRDSDTWSGTLCGNVQWSTVPDRPVSVTVGPHPTEELGASVTIAAATEDGGNAITGYQLYQSTDGGSSWSTVGSPGASGVRLLTGLTDGVSYLFAASTINSRGTSQRRAAAAAYIPESPSNINRYSGSAFEDKSVSRYDGATSDRATMQRWDGSAWVDTA